MVSFQEEVSVQETNLSYEVIPYEDPEVMTKPWIRDAHFIPVVLVYSLCCTFGSIGNALVIWAMQCDRRSRTVTAMFLVSLAVADILLLLSAAPDVASYFVRKVHTGNVSCKMVGFSRMLSAFSTVLNLMAVTAERFIVIVYPMQSRQLCTIKNCKILLVIVWTLSLAMAMPSLFTWEVEPFYYGKFDNSSKLISDTVVNIFLCDEVYYDDIMSIYRLTFLFILPLAVHCWCYGWMICVLWISANNLGLTMHSGGFGGQNIYVPYSKSQSQRTVPDRTSYTHEQRRNMADANLQETIFGNGKLMEDAACPKQSLKPVANNDPLIEKFRFRHNRTESLAFTECPKRVLPKKPMVVCFLSNCRMVSTSPDSPSDFSAVRSSGPPPDKRQDLRAGRRQIIKMLLAINFAFLIGWGPAVIFDVLRLYGVTPIGNATYVARNVVKLLPYAHCCLNPIIYGFMSKNFRSSLRKACMIGSLCGSHHRQAASKLGTSTHFPPDSPPGLLLEQRYRRK